MMRKVFGGTLVLSIVGAVVLGGVLAFVSSHTTPRNTFLVGDATWSIVYESVPSGIVGPNGTGGWQVGVGGLVNDANSTLNIAVDPDPTRSLVRFTDANPSGCQVQNFAGHVLPLFADPTSNDAQVPPGLGAAEIDQGGNDLLDAYQAADTSEGLFSVTVDNNNTNLTCYGATVGYQVVIGVLAYPGQAAQGTATSVPPTDPPAGLNVP